MRNLIAKIILAVALIGGFSGVSRAEPRHTNATSFCKRNPIYCGIKKLKPKMPRQYAMKMSNLIHKYSRIYKTEWQVTLAIGMVETGLRNINRIEKVSTKNSAGYSVYSNAVTDIGPWQLHVDTIATLGIDPELLQHDLEYQVREHIKILRYKVKVCSNPVVVKKWNVPIGEEYSCYHSLTPRFRKIYAKKVNKVLKRLYN